jgi:acyl-CoA thioester hydrolase
VSERVCVTEIRVRYSETDQMGVAYHAHYLVWCEVGRTDFIRGLGTAYTELERRGILLAVSEARVRYAASARYDDIVRVRTRVTRAQSRAISFAYELARVDGETEMRIASAETRLIAIDRSGATRKLPAELLEGLREAISSVPG